MNGIPEIAFWLLLLGSLELLQAGGSASALGGVVGVAAFLALSVKSLGKLKSLGLSYAAWCPASATEWGSAASLGLSAGGATSALVSGMSHHLLLSDDWKLVLLQVTVGPVLEELVFRGYLFALLACTISRFVRDEHVRWIVVSITAALFSASHLAQPGSGWLQFVAIGSTGVLYGLIRHRTRSSALSALAHASYNLGLYCGSLI